MKKEKNIKMWFGNSKMGESMWIQVDTTGGFCFLFQFKPMSLAYRKLVSTQKIGELVESLNLGRI